MGIHDLSPSEGSRRKRKRVGRGPGSGHGKTSCRGHKGQKARSGGAVARGFEGGQMPLQRRVPKRGFNNIFKKTYALINLRDLEQFEADSTLDAKTLKEAGLVKRVQDGIKLLGQGEVSHPLRVKVNKASRTAVEKIEAAGGSVELV
ncbi:MAG: 50S ribosomal protein L15 [Desulfatiglandales bacterium]